MFAATVLVIFGPSLAAHMRLSADPGRLNDDSRAQIYPMFRYEDPDLFPNDYIADYYLARLPVAYRGLYRLGASLLGVEALSKVLPYLLLAITVACLVRVAHRFAGMVGAWTAAALCLGASSLYLNRMVGGLPRGFGFPIEACAMAALASGNVRGLALLVPLGAGFYPVAAVPVAFSLGALLLCVPPRDRGAARDWPFRKRVVILAATAVMAAVILLPTLIASRPYGPMIGPADVGTFPEAGAGGRLIQAGVAPFRDFFSDSKKLMEEEFPPTGKAWVKAGRAWWVSDRSHHRLRLALYTLLAIAAVGWLRLACLDSQARRVLLLFPAALLGHVLATWLHPILYLPPRYVLYTVPLLATLMLATGASGFLPDAASKSRWLRPLGVGAFCGVALALFACRGGTQNGLTVSVDPDAPIYRFLRGLPKDSLIAGWPVGLAENVPYVTRRAVLVAREMHQVFDVQYALEMRRRANAVIEATYATDLGPLIRLREKFGVTHWVVDREIARKNNSPYFRPFDEVIDRAVRRGSGQQRVGLRELPAEIFDDGRYAVIDLRRLSASSPASPVRGEVQ